MTNDTATEPDELFHYTTPQGLLGILQKGVMFATDCRFVNDEQELKQGLKIARQLWETRREEEGEDGSNIPYIDRRIEWIQRTQLMNTAYQGPLSDDLARPASSWIAAIISRV